MGEAYLSSRRLSGGDRVGIVGKWEGSYVNEKQGNTHDSR